MNKAILKGNVGGEPEFRTFDNGGGVAEFSLATNRKFKNRDGELVEQTEWHRCKVYGNRAEVIDKYVSKGDPLLVEGRIQYRSYEDAEGETKYITEIIVDDFHFLGGNRDGGESATPPAAKSTRGGSNTKGSSTKGRKRAVTEDDGLPF